MTQKIKVYDAAATPAYPDMPQSLQGPHDGALRALYQVLPNTSVRELIYAFNNCCQRWPYAGVTNTEFNIALASLQLKDRFEYAAPESMTLEEIQHKPGTTILLLHGFWAVVRNGVISYQHKTVKHAPSDTVYCWWRLEIRDDAEWTGK